MRIDLDGKSIDLRGYTDEQVRDIALLCMSRECRDSNVSNSGKKVNIFKVYDVKSIEKAFSSMGKTFGIGGSRAQMARPVAAYKRLNNATGEWVKYYSYTDLLPAGINDDKALIDDVYMSPEDAASHGYYHDPLYMN